MSITSSSLRSHASAFALLLFTSACHGTLTIDDGVQGSGVARTESRDVTAFQTIELDGSVQLVLTTGPLGKLSITGDDNLVPLVSTTVTGGKLVVRETKNVHSKTPLVISITAPDVTRIESNGAGTVRASGLTGPSFTLAAAGASSADLSGQVDKLDISVGGAGRIRAGGLVSREANVEIAGTGAVEVDATEKLKATVSGVGEVRYRGSPTVEKTVSGVGTVKPI